MAWQRIGADSWASSMVLLMLVVSLDEVRPHVEPWLRKLSGGQPLIQGRLTAQHGKVLACMHFMPGRCIQNWDVVKGTGPAVTVGPMFLGGLADSVADSVGPSSK